MIKRFLDNAVNVCRNIPRAAHVLFSRPFACADGEIVSSETFDDTEFDHFSDSDSPSFVELVKIGEKPPKIQSAPRVNGLAEAVIARDFVARFKAAAAPAAAPAPAPAPAADPAPAPAAAPAAE